MVSLSIAFHHLVYVCIHCPSMELFLCGKAKENHKK